MQNGRRRLSGLVRFLHRMYLEKAGNFIRYYNNFRIKENLGYISLTKFLEKYPFGIN